MMKNVHKIPLNLEQYDQYGIDQQYSAYVITLEGISEQEAEDYEYQYQSQGYQIFSSQLGRMNGESFRLKLILASLPYVF